MAFLSGRVMCVAACVAVLTATTLGADRARGAEVASAGGAPFGASSNLRQDALRTMPLTKLTPQGRSLAQGIINDTTVFRRLPTQQIECDSDMYAFLLEYPELVINMWEVMGVTKVRLTRIGPTSWNLDDGNGTTGKIHVLYRSPTQHVIYAEGTYIGSMFPRPIRGRTVVSIRHLPGRAADGRSFMQCRLDSFVQLDNFGLELIAKTFHTALGNIADHNLKEITGFVSSVHQAAETAPENLERITVKCNRVTERTKQDFLVLADRIYEQAMGRAALTTRTPSTAVRGPVTTEGAAR